MGGGRHIESHEVELPVIVDVPRISPHGKPGRVIDHRGDGIGEGAIPIIAKQVVRIREIIADVEIHQPIVVIVPPGGCQAVAAHLNSGRFTDILEHAVVITQENVGTAYFIHVVVTRPLLAKAIEFPELRLDHRPAVPGLLEGRLDGTSSLPVVAVGQEKHIEIAILVIVTESRQETGIDPGQTEPGSSLFKLPHAVVQVERIGRVVVADVEVEVSIVVKIGQRCPRAPGLSSTHPGCRRDVFKSEGGPSLPVEFVLPRAARKEEIRKPVTIDVAYGHPTTHKAGMVEPLEGMADVDPVLKGNPGLLRRKPLEESLPRRFRTRRESFFLQGSLRSSQGGGGIRLRGAHWRIVVVPATAFPFDFRTFTGGNYNEAQCKERARYKSPGGGMIFRRPVHGPKGSPKKSPAMNLAGEQSWEIPFPAVVHIKSLGTCAHLTPTANEDAC